MAHAVTVDDIAHDVNGEYYVVGQQGEVEELLPHRLVYVMAGDVVHFTRGAVVGSPPRNEAILRTFKINFWKLLELPADRAVTIPQARRIAWLRAHALAIGLGDVERQYARNGLTYSDIVIIADPVAPAAAVPGTKTISGAGVVEDGATADIRVGEIYGFADDREWRAQVTKKVTNMICMLAFFMRTRGHHWTPDSADRFPAIWRRCLYDEDDAGLPWEMIAHHAYHFIYPNRLDEFWQRSANAARCAGTLIKRFDCYAAGTAIIGACAAGADDVCVLFPTIRAVIPHAFKELDKCRRLLAGSRWRGSINRRFYSAEALDVDEKALGPLAALILGSLESVTSGSQLRESRALKRVAENAPITGSLIVALLKKAAADKRMVDFLFLRPASDKEEEEEE